MFKPKETERILEVILTEQEIADRSREMSKLVINRRRLKAEAKTKAEGYAAEIKLLDQQIESEASIIEDGKEFRKVKCVELLAANGVEVEIIRTDTGEIVAVRAMTEQERQGELFAATYKTEPTAEPDAPAISEEHGHLCPVCNETYLCNLACPEEMPERTCADCEEETEEPADKWTELLDEAEAELAAEAATKPEWESRELIFEDYLSYALTTGVKNPRKEARRWFDSGQLVADVRHHLKTQAEQTKLFDEEEKPKAEPRRRKGKIKTHEEGSYEAGL